MHTKVKNYLSIFVFAFLGGITRAFLNYYFGFYGTFWGNIIGCFLLAFSTYFFLQFKDFYEWLSVGLGTGFIGAFTTFSTFNLDSLKMLENGLISTAAIYLLSSIIFGFIFAYLGENLGISVGKVLNQGGN